MNYRKAILTMGLILLLMLSSAVAYARTDNTVQNNEVFMISEQEKEALAKYNRNIDSEYLAQNQKAASNYEKLIKSFEDTKTAKTVYPNYYGGSYIDSNNNLVIYLNNATVQKLEAINSIKQIIKDDGFVIVAGNHSYNELNGVMAVLNEFVENNSNSEIAGSISTFYVSDRDNSVVVELDSIDIKQIEHFKKEVIDSPIIVFEPSSGSVTLMANIDAGRKINGNLGGGSMGYRAKRGGKNGFVTCQHVASSGTVSGTGTLAGAIGTVAQSVLGGNVDCAFVETVSAHTPTNTLNGLSSTISTSISSPGVGTIIYKNGDTTGLTSGIILSTNASISHPTGGIIKNQTKTDCHASGGDSGGIVYQGDTSRSTLGIMVGAAWNNPPNMDTYYSKANEINTALGCSRY